MYNIIKLLNLEDDNFSIDKVDVVNQTKVITISKAVSINFCPLCNTRMYSRGIRLRKVNHPIMQDGYTLTLLLRQRRWRCSNPSCKHKLNDTFGFIDERKRNTNITTFLVLDGFRNLNSSAADIAKRFNISDTQALTIFDKYVDLHRLKLPKVLCVDEVFINIDKNSKYALVLLDFQTGEVVDFLKSRRSEFTEEYFLSIPKEERLQVEYLIADMYAPYFNYIGKYFLNAIPVVDSFHVIKWINNLINNYLIKLQRKHKEKDKIRRVELERQKGYEIKYYRSKETYLLQKHRWVILSNQSNLNYNAKAKYNSFLQMHLDTYAYESDISY